MDACASTPSGTSCPTYAPAGAPRWRGRRGWGLCARASLTPVSGAACRYLVSRKADGKLFALKSTRTTQLSEAQRQGLRGAAWTARRQLAMAGGEGCDGRVEGAADGRWLQRAANRPP